MAGDLLGDILRATGDKQAVSTGISEVIGAVVGQPQAPAAVGPVPDLAPLAALDEAGARAFLRRLPADQVVPLLARAPLAVAQRLVGVMDAESRAWLDAQNEEIEAVDEAAHRTAASTALAILARLRVEARPVPAVPARAPVPPPVQVSVGFAAAPPPAVVEEPAPAAPAMPAVDPTANLLADLVDAARGCRPGDLRQLAEGVDHPILAAGLGLVAEGVDPHELDAALRTAVADHLEAEGRRLELIRRAVMAIRFGEPGTALRQRSPG